VVKPLTADVLLNWALNEVYALKRFTDDPENDILIVAKIISVSQSKILA